MSLFTPQEHADNAPDTWQVVKRPRCRDWAVLTKDGGVITTAKTKSAALQLTKTGFYTDLYWKEKKYYAGENVPGWKPSPYPKPSQVTVASAELQAEFAADMRLAGEQ